MFNTCVQVVAAPIAAGLLMLDGKMALRGWQWVFLLEGAAGHLLFWPEEGAAHRQNRAPA